jgi:hypothetical protein
MASLILKRGCTCFKSVYRFGMRGSWHKSSEPALKRKGSKRDSHTSSAARRAYEAHRPVLYFGGPVEEMEMEEKETTMKDSIEYLLEGLLRNKHADDGHVGFVHTPVEISASPEEGVLLIRAFLRIKQPELRAAIIDLATRMADLGSSIAPAQN